MPQSLKLTQRQIDRAIADYVAGKSAPAIASRLRVTFHAIRYHLIKADVWQGDNHRRKLTAAQLKKAATAYEAGEPASRIANRLGVTLNAIRYHFKRLGIWAGRRDVPLENRFWAKVHKTESCWMWTGSKFPDGYGCFSIYGESRGAHRVSYELAHGPVPIGLVLDHLCRNKPCVNPAHLEPVTTAVNVKRGMDFLGKKYTLTEDHDEKSKA